MKREDFEVLAFNRLQQQPKVYKYLLDRVKKDVYVSYSYKKQCYCTSCQEIFIHDEKKCDAGICPKCKKKYKLINLGNVRNERIHYLIFSVLDYDNKNNVLFLMNYCIGNYYNFDKGIMTVKTNMFSMGCDAYDLKNGYTKFYYKNVFLTHFGNYKIFDFGNDARVKTSRNPFEKKDFLSSSTDTLFFVNDIFYTTVIKNNFFKYISYLKLKIDFGYTDNLVNFVRSLYIYPKIETLYKLEECRFTERVKDFFLSVVDCLRIKGSKYQYYKFDYGLMKDIYISEKGYIDFCYYIVNIRLGKPYVYDKKLIEFFVLNLSLLSRKTYDYLSKRKHNDEFNLYSDYIRMCKKLNLSLKTTSILYPKKLAEKHDELSSVLNEKEKAREFSEFKALSELYELLNFEEDGYKFYLPASSIDFKVRGNMLRQCLFSMRYDQRYCGKNCIIVFIDSLDNKLTGKFTLELTNKLSIVQLHGFANDINASKEQLKRLAKVKKIINKRLSLLEMNKSKIIYKNLLRSNIIEVKNEIQV